MIITSPKLLTLQYGIKPINNGAVVVSRGTILVAGLANKIIEQYPGHRVLRLENTVLLPGLVNLHTHLELPHMLDAIRATTFTAWVLNLIKAKRNLLHKNYAAAVRTNIRTLIHTGTTTVGEICTHGRSQALLRKSGLRAKVFFEVITMSPSSPISFSPFLIEKGLVQFGISPHTPYTVSERVLLELKLKSYGTPATLAMHMAESKDEIRLLQGKKSGLAELYHLAGWDLSWAPSAVSSFEYLQRIGLLSPGLLAIHAVQVTNNDIAIIRKSKVSIAHCPRSNKETGVGRMPLNKFLIAGITVGLGTDSLASSPSLSMWDEMRYAYQIHRRNGVTAEDIFRLATINGAKALGLDKEIGTLEPGKKADIIAVPLPKKDTGNLYSDLLRETKSCIMSVVNGKILYRDIPEEKP